MIIQFYSSTLIYFLKPGMAADFSLSTFSLRQGVMKASSPSFISVMLTSPKSSLILSLSLAEALINHTDAVSSIFYIKLSPKSSHFIGLFAPCAASIISPTTALAVGSFPAPFP